MGGIITYLIFSFYFLSFCPIFFYFHSQIIHRTLNGRHHHVFNFSFILFFSIFYSYFHLQIIHRTLNRRYHHVFDFSFFFFFLIFIGRSFIGHSMGGIITRAALAHPLLRKYRPKMHTYCSLGSPHLGYIYTGFFLFFFCFFSFYMI